MKLNLKFFLTATLAIAFISLTSISDNTRYECYELNEGVQMIIDGLSSEDDWESAVQILSRAEDEAEDDYPEELFAANSYHDFVCEFNPYSGQNCDLDSDEFVFCYRELKSFGFTITNTLYRTDARLPLEKVTMYNGLLEFVIINNSTDCLYLFEADLGNGDKFNGGVDKKSIRELIGYATGYENPEVKSIIFKNSSWNTDCN